MYRSAPSPTRLRIAARSAAGRKLKGNLDAYVVTDFDRCVARDPLAAAESVAGLAGIALSIFSGHFLDWSRNPAESVKAASAGFRIANVASGAVFDGLTQQGAPRGDGEMRRRLGEILWAAHNTIQTAARDRRFVDTAASATVAVVQRERVEIAQAGETRAYHRRGNRLAQVSQGDRVENDSRFSVNSGVVGPANLVVRSLGVPVPIEPSYFSVDLRPGDTLLLCTRGLTAVLGDSDILDFIRRHEEPSAICAALVKAAVDGRCEHNVTVVAATPIVVADEPQNLGGWR
jgi:serine/threonine protein phosphatase PrpC